MVTKAKKKETKTIEVVQMETGELTFCLVGKSPFVCNAMSSKVRQGLLLPPKKLKGDAAKEAHLKHNPPEEYRASCYRYREDDQRTRIYHPGAAFRKAMATSALETDDTTKAQVGRLSWISEYDVGIYGVPELWMTNVILAGQSRAPAIRTRAIIPEWACRVTVEHVLPRLQPQAVINLMAIAGMIIGVGDGRNEKGALSFGQFRIAREGDAAFKRICKAGGRKAQDAALKNPTTFDSETDELLSWWHAEVKRRGFKVAA